jgi:hypothetical protein
MEDIPFLHHDQSTQSTRVAGLTTKGLELDWSALVRRLLSSSVLGGVGRVLCYKLR